MVEVLAVPKSEMGQKVATTLPNIETVAFTLANTATADAYTLRQGVGYLIVTFPPQETYIIGEDYPTLARIWDNDEDDAAFASL